MDAHVIWTDVAPRDGLQSWKKEPVATDIKVRLIRGLLAAGVPRVEATAFVSPEKVPQMADASEVLQTLGAESLSRLRVLIPNLRGLEKALQYGISNVLLTIGATDAFNRANINRSVDDSLRELPGIVEAARASNCQIDVALSVSFGCPYEGEVPDERVVSLCRQFAESGIDEIGIADTIGVAVPAQVRRLLAKVTAEIPAEKLSLHFHDTRGLGVVNVLAGYQAGVRRFDGSAAGVGGCPFAPRSTGNVCSEDALQALRAEGAAIDADLGAYCEVSAQLAHDLGTELPGKLYRAGIWHGVPVNAGTE